jgi:hypothetical protein
MSVEEEGYISLPLESSANKFKIQDLKKRNVFEFGNGGSSTSRANEGVPPGSQLHQESE